MSKGTDTTIPIIALSIAGGSLLVAIWAAWNAHMARRWQRQKDAERLATRMRFEWVHSSGPQANWPLVAGGNRPMPQPPTVYKLSLSVINNGEQVEYVTAVFLKGTGPVHGSKGLRVRGSEGGIEGTEVDELRPRGVLHVPVDLDRECIEWMQDGFFAEVWLGSGEATSDVETLLPELIADATA